MGIGRAVVAVVRALASHQCGPGLIPGLSVIYALRLLLVLVPAPRVFLMVIPPHQSLNQLPQVSKNVVLGCLGQVDFLARQITSHAHLLNGQWPKEVICRLIHKK